MLPVQFFHLLIFNYQNDENNNVNIAHIHGNPINCREGYKVGDNAADFKLKNVDGKVIGLADFPNAKGFMVVFTCNNCPYAKAYQDRIIALDKKYKAKGYPVIAINPNDPAVEPADSYDAMVKRAKDKGYTFPYLFDAKHVVYKSYGATNTPHAFVLNRNDKKVNWL